MSKQAVDAEIQDSMPTFEDYWRSDRGKPSDCLVERSTSDLGNDPVPTDAFTSRDWVAAERDKLWKKVWQLACRENDIPEVGDRLVYDVVGQSVVIVRSEKGVRAFHNSCRHRGNRLVDGPGQGSRITCSFHGWSWHLDGGIAKIQCRWDFPEVTDERAALVGVRVASWDGWIFVNLDPDAGSLEDFLGAEIPRHFENWPRRRAWKAAHVGKVLPCNWKLALQAFLEGYHSVATHPQILPYLGDCNAQYDFYGPHARLIGPSGVPSPHLGEFDDQAVVDAMIGDAFANLTGEHGEEVAIPQLAPGQDPRELLADFMRDSLTQMTGRDFHDIDEVSDVEVLDGIEYFVFPNMVPWGGYALPLTYRARPNGADPGSCIFEAMILVDQPGGAQLPRDTPLRMIPTEQPWSECPELGGLGPILDQDSINLFKIQRGVESDACQDVVFANYQERNLRNFHQHLNGYLSA